MSWLGVLQAARGAVIYGLMALCAIGGLISLIALLVVGLPLLYAFMLLALVVDIKY